MEERDLEAQTGAYRPQFKFHDENLAMLAWYSARVVTVLRALHARSALSLGIGHAVVAGAVLDALGTALDYTVVEGAGSAIDSFRRSRPVSSRTTLVHALFEDFEPRSPFDAIEMGFVLEHVDDPRALLRRYREFVRPGGEICVAVPNARSLHRRIGHAAGLLDDMYRLSPQDLELGHRRYFDLDSLKALVADAGLEVLSVEGIFLKPFTTGQLASLELPPAVWRGLFETAVPYPDLANAICVVGRR